ncbi:MAG: hypothetical protein FJ039_09980 [Chloroflexi bacterium]|nr:hypothetical protein [Chloroflexota bacterium]
MASNTVEESISSTKGKTLQTRILFRRDTTPEHWSIGLEKPAGFTFKPGQYVTIGTGGIERPYSIVSAPCEPHIELYIELAPPPLGKLTPLLHARKAGDSLSIRPSAKGRFTFEPGYANQVMVATVTGIAPFLSMIRDYRARQASGQRFFILDGASYHDELAYRSELTRLVAAEPQRFAYVPTVSRPQEPRNAAWTGERGSVNTIVGKYLAQWGLAPQETIVYACGHPGMIEDVKARLSPQGWKVKEERYWKD